MRRAHRVVGRGPGKRYLSQGRCYGAMPLIHGRMGLGLLCGETKPVCAGGGCGWGGAQQGGLSPGRGVAVDFSGGVGLVLRASPDGR
ncbi:hypothetical protein GCM10022416_08730 [Actinomadura keratinilytica]|uniref:Uncharacterized protein n=1 Tax=Actinomadura keratinilytica TaxID=547461 RepID=A0ABP7Y551_9ACTN